MGTKQRVKTMASAVLNYISEVYKKLRGELEYSEEDLKRKERFDYHAVVERLVAKGWKVYVTHKRYFPILKVLGMEDEFMTKGEFDQFDSVNSLTCGYRHEVRANGGYSIITLVSPEGREYDGRADCSFLDNFSRKAGRELALERCLALHNLDAS